MVYEVPSLLVCLYAIHHEDRKAQSLYSLMNVFLYLGGPLSCAFEFYENHNTTVQKIHPVRQTFDELGQQLDCHPTLIIYVLRQGPFKYLLASLVLLHLSSDSHMVGTWGSAG